MFNYSFFLFVISNVPVIGKIPEVCVVTVENMNSDFFTKKYSYCCSLKLLCYSDKYFSCCQFQTLT